MKKKWCQKYECWTNRLGQNFSFGKRSADIKREVLKIKIMGHLNGPSLLKSAVEIRKAEVL